MIVVTGASGKLGHHVVKALLKRVPTNEIVAAVRSVAKATELQSLGVEVREADYAKPQTLAAAFAGAEKVLLISGNEIGPGRVVQHRAVIDAALEAGVKLLGYTSVLRADTTRMGLATDHLATEKAIVASGIGYVILRNGWYLENHCESLGPALEHGAVLGAAKSGRFSSASRADYAGAAAVVMTEAGHEGKVYELAGDASFNLDELAAAVSKASGKTVVYRDLPEQDFRAALLGSGLPEPVATMLADADAWAAKGELESTSHDLSKLLGQPTTSLVEAVAQRLRSSRLPGMNPGVRRAE